MYDRLGGRALINVPTLVFYNTTNNELIDGSFANKANMQASFSIQNPLVFQFTIYPLGLCDLTADIPDLRGPNIVNPPGGPDVFNPNENAGNGAHRKWDISRQLQIQIKNPNGIPGNKWPITSVFYPHAVGLLTSQPQADSIVLNFPSNDVEGNDDSISEGDANPYEIGTYNAYLAHAIGELKSSDFPRTSISDYGLVQDNTFEELNYFREFLRVNIGDKWYRVSDYLNWEFFFKTKYNNNHLQDNGSFQGTSL